MSSMTGSAPDIRALEGSWSSEGRRYAYRLWQPAAAPQALLVILHGFGEHSGRYVSFAQTLAHQGICVAGPDLWGHGRSGGARGDLGEVDSGDLRRMTEEVFLPASGQRSYALFGHSFGGLFAIQWALAGSAQEPRCLIVQSPLLDVGFPIPWWKRAAALTLARVWPRCRLPMDLDVGALSHDPSVGTAYLADPLVHNRMSACTYRSILRVRDDAFARASRLQMPILLLCGAADRIVSVEAAQRWYAQLRAPKASICFPESYHELHHEPIREELLRLISRWTLQPGEFVKSSSETS